MKLNKIQLQKHILSEVKKIATEEGWINNFPKISDTIAENKNEISFEDANIINEEIENVELEEVKLLAEEVKRMKDLVDFRSPLLRKENQ